MKRIAIVLALTALGCSSDSQPAPAPTAPTPRFTVEEQVIDKKMRIAVVRDTLTGREFLTFQGYYREDPVFAIETQKASAE